MGLQIATIMLTGLILETLLYVKYWLLLQKCSRIYLTFNRSLLSVLRCIAMALGQQPFKEAQRMVNSGKDS
jgi:hypothetical protein